MKATHNEENHNYKLFKPNNIQITPRSNMILYSLEPIYGSTYSPRSDKKINRALRKVKHLSSSKEGSSIMSQYSPKNMKVDPNKINGPAVNLGEKLIRLYELINDPILY